MPPTIQDDKAAFTVLSVKDGLVNSAVSGIVQDSKGFIWFATQGGLCRYDGSEFKVFENEPFNDNSLAANLIQTLYLDTGDVLWIGTYNGLDRFDIATEKFTLYTYDPAIDDSLSNDLVITISRDARGALWAGTLNGLNRLDENTGKFKRSYNDQADPRSLSNNTVRSLHKDRQGRLWVGTSGGGFARYDYEADAFDNLTGTRNGPPKSASLQAISEDADGYLWLGAWGTGLVRFSPDRGSSEVFPMPDNRIYTINTQSPGLVRIGTWGGGLHVLDTASKQISSYQHSKALGVLPHDVVYSMMVDQSGELWIGTNGGGVARMDRTRKSFTAYVSDPSDPDALPHGKALAILVDSRGDLWASIYSGGIHRLDRTTGSWTHFRHDAAKPSSLPDDTCNVLYEDSSGKFWVGTNAGLALMDRERGTFVTRKHIDGNQASLSSDIIYSLLEEPGGGLWIGTYTSGLDYWDMKKDSWTHYGFDPVNQLSISDNLVNSIVRDSKGKLWIATNNGLNRMEGGTFIRYHYANDNRSGVSSNAIQRLFLDSKGILWIASRGGGLMRYLPDSDSFTHIMRTDGLPNNMVTAVLEDLRSDLWVVTLTGIALYDRETASVKPVSFYKELDNATFNSGACMGPKGELYFGSVGIVTEFDPARYESNSHVPPVFVTEIRAANQSKLAVPASETPPGSPIHLSNYENSVEFRFAAIDFRDPQANQFAYKLEGFDKDWTYVGNRNYAAYTNLGGGTYTFRVRASNNDGLWNEGGAAIHLKVAAPLFLSPIAILLYLMTIGSLGYGAATLRSNQLLKVKVTELTKAEEALKAADKESRRLAEEADKANRAKSSFIAMVSHEIRTPLNGVIGMTELLARSDLDERKREQVSTIQKSGETLLGIINNVLDFSKVEAQKMELEDIAYNLNGMMEGVLDAFRYQAKAKGLAFESNIAAVLPEAVRGDPLRTGQILRNFIGNAIKFTDRGFVRVLVDQTVLEGKAALRFRVMDSGIGIKEESLATLFTPFSQEDQSTTRRFGGTGLGLSISKRLVDLMNGRIEYESTLGKGSSFACILPLVPASATDTASVFGGPSGTAVVSRTPAALASGKALNVLVVDDDPVNRRVAESMLEEIGMHAMTADSGHAAIVELSKRKYDAVLMDCSMPGMDGFETAQKIRKPANGVADPTIRIIAMTAHTLKEDRDRCIAAGMDDFMTKPLTIAALESAFAKMKSNLDAATPAGLDVDGFLVRYHQTPELGQEIVNLFLENARPLLGEVFEAHRNASTTVVSEKLHKLKGSSGAIGAERLANLCNELMSLIRGSDSDSQVGQLALGLVEIDAELAVVEAALRQMITRL